MFHFEYLAIAIDNYQDTKYNVKVLWFIKLLTHNCSFLTNNLIKMVDFQFASRRHIFFILESICIKELNIRTDVK